MILSVVLSLPHWSYDANGVPCGISQQLLVNPMLFCWMCEPGETYLAFRWAPDPWPRVENFC